MGVFWIVSTKWKTPPDSVAASGNLMARNNVSQPHQCRILMLPLDGLNENGPRPLGIVFARARQLLFQFRAGRLNISLRIDSARHESVRTRCSVFPVAGPEKPLKLASSILDCGRSPFSRINLNFNPFDWGCSSPRRPSNSVDCFAALVETGHSRHHGFQIVSRNRGIQPDGVLRRWEGMETVV